MRFGRFLKTQDCLAAIFALRMTTWQQFGFGKPGTVFVLSNLNFLYRNYHASFTYCYLPLDLA